MLKKPLPRSRTFTGEVPPVNNRVFRRKQKGLELEQQMKNEKTQKRWEKQAAVRSNRRSKVKKEIKVFPGEPIRNKRGQVDPMWHI